jgi:hypothetical protein
MAGIFGYWFWDNSSQLGEVYRTLQGYSLAGFAHKSEFKLFSDDKVCLGYASRFSSPDSEIFSTPDSRYFLALSGELFLPSGEQLNAYNFITEFIPQFKKKAKSFFTYCEGAFVLALYDEVEQSLSIATDPFGNFSLHYSNTSAGFIFSFQQKAIAEILGAELDEQAISQYIALGHQLNYRSFYKNILRLPPASFVKIERSGKVDFSLYFVPDFTHGLNHKELLAHIEESLLRSVDIRTRRSGTIVGLSGGLDSRMTFAAIKKLDRERQVTVFTHGLPGSGDISVASRITRKYDIPHLKILFDDAFFKVFPSLWREAIALSESGLGVENAMAIHSWGIESKQSAVSLDSHAGALYRRQFHKAREGVLRRSNNFSETFFDQFAMPLFHSDLISPEWKQEALQIGMQNVSEFFLGQRSDLDIGDKIDLYYLTGLCANKYALSGNAQINYIGLSHPLLSLEAYAAALHIPANERRTNIIYRYLFNRFAPELKNFLADDSGYPVPYHGYSVLRYAGPVLERGLRILPESFNRFSVYKPVITRRLIVEKSISAIREILEGSSQSILIPEKIKKSLSDFRKGARDTSPELLQAVNLVLLLDYFASRP